MQRIALLLLLFTRLMVSGQQQITLVKDIYTGADGSYANAAFAQNGAVMVFNAKDETHGYQLWRSNGTEAGTFLLKELFASPSNNLIGDIAVFQDKFWFIVSGKLYQSDGTTAGTTVVKTFDNPDFYYGPVFVVFKNELYFSYGVSGQGEELWKTNGTSAGTVLVKDINPGGGHGRPDNFMVFGDQLLFNANDGVNGFELWKTDGTTAGTALVKNIRPGNLASGIFNGIGTPIGAFFIADDGTTGKELWVSDGTAAGTHVVRDINPAGNGLANQLAGKIFHGYLNGKVVFVANDGENGDEPWATDGTEAGTDMIMNIGPTWQHGTVYSSMWIFAEKAFFLGSNGKLWVTDGTAAGTSGLDATINSNSITDIVLYDGKYSFIATANPGGEQVWETDGTSAGTQVLADLLPNSSADELNTLVPVSNTLFLYGTDGVTGQELYSIGGAAVHTTAPSDQPAEIQVRPNPTSDLIRLDLPGDASAGEFEILDLNGRILRTWTATANGTVEINVAGLPTGTYFLHIVSSKQHLVGRFTVTR